MRKRFHGLKRLVCHNYCSQLASQMLTISIETSPNMEQIQPLQSGTRPSPKESGEDNVPAEMDG